MIANLSTSTWVFIIFIIGVFLWFAYQLFNQWQLNKVLHLSAEADDVLETLKGGKLKLTAEEYSKTIAIDTMSGGKTNNPASMIINDASTTKAYHINLRMLDAASGLMVGLGLFGTFWGLTEGISGFDSSTTDNIRQSIQGLLGGMSTAFLTSLVGMGASMLFTWWDKALKKTFYHNLDEVCDQLDAAFYIDDLQLARMQQQQMMDGMTAQLRQEMRGQIEALLADIERKLTYTKEDGEQVVVANAIREILARQRSSWSI